MGIKKTRVVYVSDRDIEFDLGEMKFSHLVNALAHHKKQLETLRSITEPTDFMQERAKALKETIAVLEGEIRTRDPKDDPKEDEDRRFYGGY